MLYCRDVWSRRVGYSTAAVTLGVIAELPEVAYALNCYVSRLMDKLFMQRTNARKEEPEWFAVVGAIGLLLVIVGVAGEWRFDENLSTANAALANFDHQQTLKAQQDAGDAQKSATLAKQASAKALADSGTAEGQATQAESKAGNASRTASTASESANQANLKSIELTKQLEATSKELESVENKRRELELALKNLTICTSPRVIPFWLANGTSYFAPLLPLAGQKVSIEYIPYDAEARRAAIDLARTLQAANWDLQLPLKRIDGLADGVFVQPFPTGPTARTTTY